MKLTDVIFSYFFFHSRSGIAMNNLCNEGTQKFNPFHDTDLFL